jgi:hypothetical protein
MNMTALFFFSEHETSHRVACIPFPREETHFDLWKKQKNEGASKQLKPRQICRSAHLFVEKKKERKNWNPQHRNGAHHFVLDELMMLKSQLIEQRLKNKTYGSLRWAAPL